MDFPVCLFAASLFTFSPFSSTNSEEAKSTTWLHPVTGEAVVTGHRKTPGKSSEDVFHTHPRAHAAPGKGCPRVTAVGEEREGADKLRGEWWKTMREDFFSLQQSNSLPCSAPLRSPLCSPLADHYARRPSTSFAPPLPSPPRVLAPPGHFATHFLKVPSRRREPISEPISPQ